MWITELEGDFVIKTEYTGRLSQIEHIFYSELKGSETLGFRNKRSLIHCIQHTAYPNWPFKSEFLYTTPVLTQLYL